ncbi:MAG: malto-oligosyltrehalose synthase [Peptococcaceae bacterium]|nr:malto-oligosyltrehalose synthase [Peptococcaceae bacterium]
MAHLRIPGATYRLQFNRQFRFSDARALVPYLQALGITDLYASPLLKARQGSPHGYDVTDPTRLNPELGGEEAFSALAESLKQHGMGLLLDIVPNHMAASSENPWWVDVLRHGPDSPYSSYFDVDWHPARPGLTGKVLIPILGAPYGKTLENRELTLTLAENGFWVCYHEWRLPLSPRSYHRILRYRLEELAKTLGAGHPAVRELKNLAGSPDELCDRAAFQRVVERLWQLYYAYPEIKKFIDENLRLLNGRKEDPASFDRLDRILSEQAYRLAFWRVAREEINYRRFFDVSELVSLRMEDGQVFSSTHALVLQLAGAGQVTGLRVDHIDGLHDPTTYLERLQNRLSSGVGRSGFYVVAEKILSGEEELPRDWPVYGTTGYDFLNTVNGLFVDGQGAAVLDKIYCRLTGSEADFTSVVLAQKRRVMKKLFAGEVRTLARSLGRLAERDRHGRDLTLTQLEDALVEVTARLPVYRTYLRDFTITARDRRYIERTVGAAGEQHPALGPAFDFLRRVLLLEFPDYLPAEQRQDWLRFVMRWQQFTGPIMAKGFEDTALYVYNRLVSLNEVGGDPGTTGIPVAEFHRRNKKRQERWPHTLNATSTHDTKRSEDVRARVNVLSEIPAVWAERLEHWCRLNQSKKPVVNGKGVPDGNMELLVYQTLLGAWPLREEEVPAFKERLQAYLVKAAREGKVHTSWLDLDTGYEDALKNFVASILEPEEENRFLEDFTSFQKFIAYYGALNSLAQVLVKITSPGVPDFYQGTELWNFSLVDPDNRRPVDFKKRAQLLTALQEEEKKSGPLVLAQKLLASWRDGHIKLYLTYKALHFRRAHRELFAAGEYLPVETKGSRYEHVCAFARRAGSTWALVVVPRLLVRLQTTRRAVGAGDVPPEELPTAPPLGEPVWDETGLILPAQCPDRWRNVLTGETVTASPGTDSLVGSVLPLAGVFRNFPVALMAPA